MANFFADWRNPVLVIGIIGTVLFGSLWFKQYEATSTVAIVVGDKQFTNQDLVNELKSRAGNNVVMKVVMASLMDEYAKKKGVTVSDSEVDQLEQFAKDQWDAQSLGAQDFTSRLKDLQMSESDFRKDLRAQALQIKFIFSQDELNAGVAAIAKIGRPPFAMPNRYRYRVFTFGSKEGAEAAIPSLQKGDDASLSDVAANSMSPGEAKRLQFYAPGLTKSEPKLDELLKSMKPGDVTRPAPSPGENGATLYSVLQLADFQPATKPTIDNSYMVAGQFLLQTGQQKYAPRMQTLESSAIQEIVPTFFTSDYSMVSDYFKKKQQENPSIPGVGAQPAPTSTNK